MNRYDRIIILITRILLGLSLLTFFLAMLYPMGDASRPFEGSQVYPDGTINRKNFEFLSGDLEYDKFMLEDRLNRLEYETHIIANIKHLYENSANIFLVSWVLLFSVFLLQVLAVPKYCIIKRISVNTSPAPST